MRMAWFRWLFDANGPSYSSSDILILVGVVYVQEDEQRNVGRLSLKIRLTHLPLMFFMMPKRSFTAEHKDKSIAQIRWRMKKYWTKHEEEI